MQPLHNRIKYKDLCLAYLPSLVICTDPGSEEKYGMFKFILAYSLTWS